MFHKVCKTCKNKTCLKTHSLCKSLEHYLKKKIEHKPYRDLPLKKRELQFYQYLTEGIDNKAVMEEN